MDEYAFSSASLLESIAVGDNPIRYWRQDDPTSAQNFGDYLTNLFMRRMFSAPIFEADAYRLIGSVIHEDLVRNDIFHLGLDEDDTQIAFWGCGVRGGEAISPWLKARSIFFGVRGPMSRDLLGLPEDTILGDPGLLVPLLHPRSMHRKRKAGPKRSLCIPHILDPKSDTDILAETGANLVHRATIDNGMDGLIEMIEEIAGARFVLSGALHGAIVAAAFGVPFAFYDSGYIDIPFKWEDFSLSVNIPCYFSSTIAEGREFYKEYIHPAYRPVSVTPMLLHAPLSVRSDLIVRAMVQDGLLSPRVAKGLVDAAKLTGPHSGKSFDVAQRCWVRAIEKKRRAKLDLAFCRALYHNKIEALAALGADVGKIIDEAEHLGIRLGQVRSMLSQA